VCHECSDHETKIDTTLPSRKEGMVDTWHKGTKAYPYVYGDSETLLTTDSYPNTKWSASGKGDKMK
jgi:hypothetical protein